MIDMALITGGLVLLSFIAGIIKVTKISMVNVVVLAGMALISFTAPALLTDIAILNTIFTMVFAVLKGFAIGGFLRLGLQLMVGKITK
ncbi:MAG: hypothetical protein KAS32_18545 [Candidatus Peribacteraceae bacterium]|nr:hypothetical protein [Candidatus Peribacteraceae bacterium]